MIRRSTRKLAGLGPDLRSPRYHLVHLGYALPPCRGAVWISSFRQVFDVSGPILASITCKATIGWSEHSRTLCLTRDYRQLRGWVFRTCHGSITKWHQNTAALHLFSNARGCCRLQPENNCFIQNSTCCNKCYEPPSACSHAGYRPAHALGGQISRNI